MDKFIEYNPFYLPLGVNFTPSVVGYFGFGAMGRVTLALRLFADDKKLSRNGFLNPLRINNYEWSPLLFQKILIFRLVVPVGNCGQIKPLSFGLLNNLVGYLDCSFHLPIGLIS